MDLIDKQTIVKPKQKKIYLEIPEHNKQMNSNKSSNPHNQSNPNILNISYNILKISFGMYGLEFVN